MFNLLGSRGANKAAQQNNGEELLTLDSELAALEAGSNHLPILRQGLFSPRPQVRVRAAELLSTLNLNYDSDTIAALQQAMNDNSPLVRWQAATILRRLGAAADLAADDAFAAWQEQLVDEVLGGLLGEATERWEAVETLGGLPLASAPHLQAKVRHYLIAALSDEQAPVRLAAAEALSDMADHLTVDALLVQLTDGDALKQRSAVVALGYIRADAAVVPLIALLRDDDTSLRLSAAAALGSIADRRALAPLIVALADDDLWVRAIAATALGKLGDNQSLASLLRLVESDESIVVRRAALGAIGSLDSYTQARPLLLRLLNEDDALLRRLAAEQLARTGNAEDNAAIRPLLHDEEIVFGQTIGEALDSLSA